ncbi:hypothetical protein P9264_22975 [Mesorhizobium sp. WSM4982]|nr:hypothetical protein [Mesorhizobium sp. WSM4982]
MPYIYNLSASIEPVASLPLFSPVPFKDVRYKFLAAHNAITELTTATLYAPYLRASALLADRVLTILKTHLDDQDAERVLPDFEVYWVKSQVEQYKTALLAEIGVLHAYFVVQKGAFDSWSLLMFGENLFPADLGSKVPEAIFDAKEAGKSLAYETPTAAGFHLFRVLECVLRRYYTHETDGKAQPKVRNIAVYVNAMQQAQKGDPRTLFLIKEISDRFRNPLIHPDAVLTVDDAIAVHGLVRAAVSEMLKTLPVPPVTTTSAAAISASPA